MNFHIIQNLNTVIFQYFNVYNSHYSHAVIPNLIVNSNPNSKSEPNSKP